MSIETHLDRARTRVRSERAAVEEKAGGLETFAARVRDLRPVGPGGSGVGSGVTAPVASGSATGSQDRRDAVRTAFAETVGEKTGDAGIAGIRTELGEDVALALAPTVDVQFTPQLKKQVLSAAAARKRELHVTGQALEREAESLDNAAESVGEVVEWLVDAEETPLSALGFGALRERHARLERFEESCEELAEQRQRVLHSTTGRKGKVGVAHRPLVASVYEDFPVTYPVLSTVTRLGQVCERARGAVRAHLVRRA